MERRESSGEGGVERVERVWCDALDGDALWEQRSTWCVCEYASSRLMKPEPSASMYLKALWMVSCLVSSLSRMAAWQATSSSALTPGRSCVCVGEAWGGGRGGGWGEREGSADGKEEQRPRCEAHTCEERLHACCPSVGPAPPSKVIRMHVGMHAEVACMQSHQHNNRACPRARAHAERHYVAMSRHERGTACVGTRRVGAWRMSCTRPKPPAPGEGEGWG